MEQMALVKTRTVLLDSDKDDDYQPMVSPYMGHMIFGLHCSVSFFFERSRQIPACINKEKAVKNLLRKVLNRRSIRKLPTEKKAILATWVHS